MLHLHGRGGEIRIAIADGFVVRAEAAGREARERLGNMLVALSSSVATTSTALDLQKQTCAASATCSSRRARLRAALREMTALQTTETVYRLFHWKRGTYEFEPGEVDWDRETVTPLRAESVLMEGFRQVDEWPVIRKRIASTAMTFERLGALEPARTGERAEQEAPTSTRRSTRSARRGSSERASSRASDPTSGGPRARRAGPDSRDDRRPLAAR